jgi:hypothetical protein
MQAWLALMFTLEAASVLLLVLKTIVFKLYLVVIFCIDHMMLGEYLSYTLTSYHWWAWAE